MRRFAFFDVDETILSLKSMVNFQEFWCAETGDHRQWLLFQDEMAKLRRNGASRERLNRQYYRYFAGRFVDEVRQRAEVWFARMERNHPNVFHAPVLARLREHQAAGEEPVFVSGSFSLALEPIANRLDVRDILATKLSAVGGRYTGAIDGPQIIGPGKVRAIHDFLARNGGLVEKCYAYGDDISDRFMLAAVGYPTIVGGDEEMGAYARQRGWPILST